MAKFGGVGGHTRDKLILGGGHRTYFLNQVGVPHSEIQVEQTDKTKFWSKKNVGLRNILGEKIQKQKNFGSGKILGQNNFDLKNVGSKNDLTQERFWVKEIFGPESFFSNKDFGSKKFFCAKMRKCWGKKNFGLKIVLAQLKFWVIKSGHRKVLCPNKF